MKPYRVAILGCSATKLGTPAQAKDLYTGPIFKLARQYAELVADRFVILSAKHGVVHPERELGPYDSKLDSRQLGKWARDVSQRLVGELDKVPDSEVLFLAGEGYFSPLEVLAKSRWTRPLKGLGIGTQKATLKRLIEEATPVTLAALVLRAEGELPPLEPGDDYSEACIPKSLWERIVRAAQAEAA